MALCKMDGCDRDAWCKEYCSKHYYYAQRNGLLPRPKCSVDGCEQPSFRKGMCNTHNLRAERHGDPSIRKCTANGETKSKTCIVDGCGKPCKAGDYCPTHYGRVVRRGGDPHTVKRLASGTATEERKKENRARALKRYFQTPHGKLRRRFNLSKTRILAGAKTDRYIDKEQFLVMWAATECAICGEPIADADKTIDHIIPVSRGGDNTIANMQIAHLRCNQLKGNRVDAANLPF